MSNLTRYPLIDDFDTTLSQSWDGATGAVYLNDVPDFTFPASTTTCIVANPGKSNMQVAEINALDSSAGTVTVSDISINKGASVAYSQQSHAVGSVVRISNNYQFWSDLVTAINSKVDGDTQPFPTYADATARDAAITSPTNGMMVYNTATGVLEQYVGGTWLSVDTGATFVNASETVAGKVELATAAERAAGTGTGGTGATLVPTNDALVKTSSGASDENKIPVLNSDGYVVAFIPSASATVEGIAEIATDTEALARTDATKIITPDNMDVLTEKSILQTTRLPAAATGTVDIAHGLSGAPRYIEAHCVFLSQNNAVADVSHGFSDGTTHNCTFVGATETQGTEGYEAINEASACIKFVGVDSSGSGNDKSIQKATASFDATNVTLSRTRTTDGGFDTDTGTAYITIIAHQ